MTPAEVDRKETLARLEGWYVQTGNPLYIWEAISRCCNSDEANTPLPDFCRVYLADAGKNITLLAWGRDFRETGTKILPEKALALVGEALSLVRARSKSAFARLQENGNAMRAALRGDEGKKMLEQQNSIEKDRAGRIFRTGEKLVNWKIAPDDR